MMITWLARMSPPTAVLLGLAVGASCPQGWVEVMMPCLDLRGKFTNRASVRGLGERNDFGKAPLFPRGQSWSEAGPPRYGRSCDAIGPLVRSLGSK